MAPLRTLHLCGELQHVAYEPTGANDVGARLRATQRTVRERGISPSDL
jgi:hypothetical protein